MSSSLHCPWCNANVAVTSTTKVGQKLPCPRCEETFTVEKLPDEIPETSEAPSAAELSTSSDPPNRKVALIVVGVMILMASVGLTYALMTQGERRRNDRITGEKPIPIPDNPKAWKPVEPRDALQLDALRYLPTGPNVIIGVHVAQMVQYQNDAVRKGGGNALKGIPIPLSTVEKILGFSLRRVDHLVVSVDETEIPAHYVAVVRGRTALNQKSIQKHLNATEIIEAGSPKVYTMQVELLGSNWSGRLSQPDEQTMILGYNVIGRHWMLRQKEKPGENHLHSDLKDLLEKQVQPRPLLFWIVGRDPKASDLWSAATKWFGLSEEDEKQARKVKTFAVWARVDNGVVLEALLNCEDEQSRATIEKVLKEALKKRKYKITTEGNSVRIQTRL